MERIVGWTKDQYEPDGRFVELLINELVVPDLQWIHEQFGREPVAQLGVFVEGVSKKQWFVGPGGILDEVSAGGINGEIRVYYRKTYKPDRSLYYYEMIFPEISPDTGFTGLTGCGDLLFGEGGNAVYRKKSQVRRYNVRAFTGPH